MATINVPRELRQKLTTSAQNAFGAVFDSVQSIDLSGIDYSFGVPKYDIQEAPSTPTVQNQVIFQNCLDGPMDVDESIKFTHTRTFTWNVSTQLSLGEELGGEVALPEGVGKISGKRTFGFSLGGGISDTTQEVIEETVDVKFQLAKCKQARVQIFADEVDLSGTVKIPVRARGSAKVTLTLDPSSLPFNSYTHVWTVGVNESWMAEGTCSLKDALNARFIATLLNDPAPCEEGPCAS